MALQVLPNATPTRVFQPSGVGLDQAIHDTKYATIALAAGPIPATTRFFSAAPSADPCADRYEQGNTIVTSGKQFTIAGIGVQLTIGAGGTLADLERTINYCAVRITTSQKEFGVFPLYMLPQGGGIQMFGGQLALTPVAPPGATVTTGATNGVPTRAAMFNLACPLIIQGNASFFMELLGPNGAGAFATQTNTGIVVVKIVLDGVESRVAA